jgi:hypothetical protein
MAKQIQVSPGLPTAALEERVHALEARLTAVTAAVRILAHGLEDVPLAVPGGRPAAEAARRAYELLLVAELPMPGPEAAAASLDT